MREERPGRTAVERHLDEIEEARIAPVRRDEHGAAVGPPPHEVMDPFRDRGQVAGLPTAGGKEIDGPPFVAAAIGAEGDPASIRRRLVTADAVDIAELGVLAAGEGHRPELHAAVAVAAVVEDPPVGREARPLRAARVEDRCDGRHSFRGRVSQVGCDNA